MMLVSMIAAMALAQAIQTNAYQMEIVVIESGHENLTTRTQIVVDEPSQAIVGDTVLNANLHRFGGGDASTLQLESVVTRNGETVIAPIFNLVRGKSFYFQSGETSGKMVRVTLAPLDK